MAAASAVIVNRRKEEKGGGGDGIPPENDLVAILTEADEAETGADGFLPASLETDPERERRAAVRNAVAMEKFLATHAVETDGGQMYFLAKSKISKKLVEKMRAIVDKRKGFTSLVFFLTVLLTYFAMLNNEIPAYRNYQQYQFLRSEILGNELYDGTFVKDSIRKSVFYPWVRRIVTNNWVDAKCGDGICSNSGEVDFPGFLGKGCPSDCGHFVNLTIVHIEIRINSIPPENGESITSIPTDTGISICPTNSIIDNFCLGGLEDGTFLTLEELHPRHSTVLSAVTRISGLNNNEQFPDSVTFKSWLPDGEFKLQLSESLKQLDVSVFVTLGGKANGTKVAERERCRIVTDQYTETYDRATAIEDYTGIVPNLNLDGSSQGSEGTGDSDSNDNNRGENDNDGGDNDNDRGDDGRKLRRRMGSDGDDTGDSESSDSSNDSQQGQAPSPLPGNGEDSGDGDDTGDSESSDSSNDSQQGQASPPRPGNGEDSGDGDDTGDSESSDGSNDSQQGKTSSPLPGNGEDSGDGDDTGDSESSDSSNDSQQGNGNPPPRGPPPGGPLPGGLSGKGGEALEASEAPGTTCEITDLESSIANIDYARTTALLQNSGSFTDGQTVSIVCAKYFKHASPNDTHVRCGCDGEEDECVWTPNSTSISDANNTCVALPYAESETLRWKGFTNGAPIAPSRASLNDRTACCRTTRSIVDPAVVDNSERYGANIFYWTCQKDVAWQNQTADAGQILSSFELYENIANSKQGTSNSYSGDKRRLTWVGSTTTSAHGTESSGTASTGTSTSDTSPAHLTCAQYTQTAWPSCTAGMAKSSNDFPEVPCSCIMPDASDPLTMYELNDEDQMFFTINSFPNATKKVPLPDPWKTKQRHIGTSNRIMGGIMIFQTQTEVQKCPSEALPSLADGSVSSHYSNLGELCPSGEHTTEPYGIDPVYLSTSKLSKLYGRRLRVSDYYDRDDPKAVNQETKKPYQFFYDEDLHAYPVWIDTNLDEKRASEWVTMLEDGFFVNEKTDHIEMYIPTFNAIENSFAITHLAFDFAPFGGIELSERTSVINIGVVDDTPENRIRFYFIEKLLLVLIAMDVFGEIWQLGRVWIKSGSPLSYFKSLWNILDWLNLVFFITMFVSRDNLISLLDEYRGSSSFRYDVYEDLTQDAHWLQLRNETGRSALHNIHAYGKFKDYHGLDKDIVLYGKMIDASNLLYTQYLLCTLTMLCRFIKVLDFQPKLALVSKTIEKAAGPLAYFSVVFVSIVFGFSFCAKLVFGNVSSSFSDLDSAVMSLFNVFLGDLDVHEEMMSTTLSFPWLCFLLVYLLITFFVLLNILLAIIVDAYVEVKDTASHTPSVMEDLKNVGRNAVAKLKGKPTLEAILAALDPNERAAMAKKMAKKLNKNDDAQATKVVPFRGDAENGNTRRGSTVDTDASVIDELEDTLETDVRAIGVDHEVSSGKQITFPLTLEFLMVSYANDPIWKTSGVDGKAAVQQMHALLSQNHQGIGENGLEDVQLAAVQHSLSVKVLEYLKERAKNKPGSKN